MNIVTGEARAIAHGQTGSRGVVVPVSVQQPMCGVKGGESGSASTDMNAARRNGGSPRSPPFTSHGYCILRGRRPETCSPLP